MPINSFDDYPMSWAPDKEKLTFPKYMAIANQLEKDIKNGSLPGNTKLPPQRELADYLDISLDTITRAYLLCRKNGLVTTRTGSGTFVCPNVGLTRSVLSKSNRNIEMGTILPFHEHDYVITNIAEIVLKKKDSYSIFEYNNIDINNRRMHAAQKWLSNFGIKTSVENIIYTTGAQNSLAITLAGLFNNNDKIAVDTYTYANFIGLANMLGIRLLAVDFDENGMIPDSLEQLCKNNTIQGIYLMPTCSNPTGISMNIKRKKEISSIIEKYGLILIEDGIYDFLSDSPLLPISNMMRERYVYINSISKSVCSGLRVGFIACSSEFKNALEISAYNCNFKSSSLNIEIASELILMNKHLELIRKKKSLAKARNHIFNLYFPENSNKQLPSVYFRWLSLPKGLSGRAMEMLAAEKNVKILGAERFVTTDRAEINAVRIAICSPSSDEKLNEGLQIIKDIYNNYH